jgi:predicted CXXCH cytochrome family protein
MKWRLFAPVVVALLALYPYSARSGSILLSKHNLSVTGPGQVRAQSETRVCVFCHTSHRASLSGPLWNRPDQTRSDFQVYDRATMVARPGQPTGSTRLCLSCHDGTVAVGAVLSMRSPVRMVGTDDRGRIRAGSAANFGHDLSSTHPVSFRYDQELALQNPRLRWPIADPAGEVGVDASGQVQCTSCHDPHSSKSERYPFWRKATFQEVCVSCHRL